MSVFSETLSRFITEKNIKIMALTRYCDLDRSTMYKILNGKRNPPSPDILDRIIQFLHLTPVESRELKEAWEITRIGPEIYYKRKSVENFIQHFPDQPAAEFSGCTFSSGVPFTDNRSDCVSLTSRQHVNHYVHQMILNEAGKTSGKIGLFLQPDYKFLFSLLASLNVQGSLSITQIMCVSTEPIFTEDHQLLNLNYLHEVFPLYMAGLDYSLLYYYDKLQSHYFNFNLFPCMILTSESALLCSSDYQSGIFFRSSDVLQMLWNLYTSYQEQCGLFFRPAPLTPENHVDVINSMFDPAYVANDLIGIQPEPCLTPFFTGTLLREIFNYELPQAENILQMAEQAFQMNMDKILHKQFCIYSTLEGLLQFVKTGLTDEIPEIFYHPLNIRQRTEVVKGVRECCQSGAYRILLKPFNHLPRNLHFCIRGNLGSMIFRNNNGESLVLNIEENRLVDIFRDYLENMDAACYCTCEAATELIDQIISDLENGKY